MRPSFEHSYPADAHRIFVVEGDEVIRSALQFILDDHNETHAFTTLDLAFARAMDCRMDSQPDVVVIGIDLLQNDGQRILGEIGDRFPDTKILIVAGSARDPLALRCLEWGAHDILGKPITFDAVCGKVDGLLRHRRQPTKTIGTRPHRHPAAKGNDADISPYRICDTYEVR